MTHHSVNQDSLSIDNGIRIPTPSYSWSCSMSASPELCAYLVLKTDKYTRQLKKKKKKKPGEKGKHSIHSRRAKIYINKYILVLS